MPKGAARVMRNIDSFAFRKKVGAAAIMSKGAMEAGSWAKVNAKWVDRSGLARIGLYGRSFVVGDNLFLVVGHKMYYGLFLELCFSGKYAILEKATRHVEKRLTRQLKAYMAKLW